MKYAFIERHRHIWPISLACEVLGVSPSGYHERKTRGLGDTSRPRRIIGNDALLVHIRAVHAESKGEYGWPRVWKQLLARGSAGSCSEPVSTEHGRTAVGGSSCQ